MTLSAIKIDKTTVFKAIQSLKAANKQILAANKIEETVDDLIFITIKLGLPSDFEHTVPVQIQLPYPLLSNEASSLGLLIVRDKPEQAQDLLSDLAILGV